MKYRLVLLILNFLVCCVLFGQNREVALSSPNRNVLFLNYPNKLKLAFSDSVFPFRILGKHAEVTMSEEDPFMLEVIPNRLDTVFLDVLDLRSGELVQTLTYRVQSLPQPILYWGERTAEEGIESRNESTLSLRYPPYYRLQQTMFVINMWKLSISGDPTVYLGAGMHIPKNIQDAIARAPEGSMATFDIMYAGTTGKMQKLLVDFTLP